MMVLILQSVPAGVRGEIARWMIEPYPGVFVGHASARVRDKLWEKCTSNRKVTGVVQIWQTNTEQRFEMRGHGDLRRDLVDLEGVKLVRIPAEGNGEEEKHEPDEE